MNVKANAYESTQQGVYRSALELALHGRYEEAAGRLTKLLRAHPQHVPALILLGKVEYYQRRFASSRRRFELALSLEPENPAAWFGLQHYAQRRRTALGLGALGIALGVLVLAGTLVAGVLRRGVSEGLRDAEERLGGRLLAVERSLAAETDSRQERDRALLESVGGLAEELRRLGGDLDERERRVSTASAALGVRLEELRDLQVELGLELKADIRELRGLIAELRMLLRSATRQ